MAPLLLCVGTPLRGRRAHTRHRSGYGPHHARLIGPPQPQIAAI